MARITRPKAGDVFAVTLRNQQLAYLQVVHAQSPGDLSDVVRVLPGRFTTPPDDIGALVAQPHEYQMFAAPRFLAADGYARRIGTWPVPDHGAWSGLRYAIVRGRGGTVQAWVLTDGRTPRERSEIAPPVPSRRNAPVWQLGPSLDVADTLMASSQGSLESSELEAWRQTQGLRGPRGITDDDDEPGVRHFGLFSEKAKLNEVVTELERQGFSCSTFANPDLFDGQLLVIKAGTSAPGFIDDQWDRVEAIVKAAGGEYDGWEASMGRPPR